MENKTIDVVIIGGSYAGLAAAMSLGRALRNVVVIDGGNPCNIRTPHSHNFITQDGETPAAISKKALDQVLSYPTVHLKKEMVISADITDEDFSITTDTNELIITRKLILATGLTDIIPGIKGFAECWGISILHCPYCHGYEFKNQQTGIMANGDIAFETLKIISNWTKELILFTNGKSSLSVEQQSRIARYGIRIIEREIVHIEHLDGYIHHIVCNDGSAYPLQALYAKPAFKQHSDLPELLGCEMNEQGLINVDSFQKTTVPGVFAAGDNSNRARSVSLAVASGSIAGIMANKEIIEEEF